MFATLEDYLLYIIAAFIIFGGLTIILFPKLMTAKVHPLSERIELANKIRATISQILGGLILAGTLLAGLYDTRSTKDALLEQLKKQESLATLDRQTNKKIAKDRDSLMIVEMGNQLSIATEDRKLLREQIDSTMKINREDRGALVAQIKVQRESSISQKNVNLFSQATTLLSSANNIDKYSAVEILYNLGISDSSYFDLSKEILKRGLSVKEMDVSIKNTILERLVDLNRFWGRRSFDKADFSFLEIRDLDLTGYVFNKCNLIGATINENISGSLFRECSIDGLKIITYTGSISLADCMKQDSVYEVSNNKVKLNWHVAKNKEDLDEVFIKSPGVKMNFRYVGKIYTTISISRAYGYNDGVVNSLLIEGVIKSNDSLSRNQQGELLSGAPPSNLYSELSSIRFEGEGYLNGIFSTSEVISD